MSVTSKSRAAGLDELLLARGLVTQEQLTEGKDQAAQRQRSLGRVLIELGFVTEAGLVSILAQQLGLEFVDLTETKVDTSAVALVPELVARRPKCLPITFDES